jgi:hypothetical protein
VRNHASECSAIDGAPGFRFHPTDEELLYYCLRKKVAYEAIDLDVIREIDLNKLEPWDLIGRCDQLSIINNFHWSGNISC